MLVRLGETRVAELLSPTRKNTPGVSRISALPVSVVSVWPALQIYRSNGLCIQGFGANCSLPFNVI